MIDRDPTPQDEDDLHAAEYVLGTLPPAEWRAARERAAVDGSFAARVADWEGRLAALNAGYAEAEVPAGALAAVEARLFAAPPAPRRRGIARGRLAGWRAAGLVAASLAVVAVLMPQAPPPAPALTASLTADSGLVLAARYDAAAARLTVMRTAGSPAPAGRDYELWAIDATGTPRSLGLLPATMAGFDAALTPGIVLAVSLEPAGGSPQPAPTGPVLATATLSGG